MAQKEVKDQDRCNKATAGGIIGGGLAGAAAGAKIGSLVGGPTGAFIGALAGGALGAVGGALTAQGTADACQPKEGKKEKQKVVLGATLVGVPLGGWLGLTILESVGVSERTASVLSSIAGATVGALAAHEWASGSVPEDE